jgi:hypothetical protein
MGSVVESIGWAVAFIGCAAAFAYLRRFIADVVADIVYQTNPLKVVARLLVLLLAVCLAIVFGAAMVALVLTWARGLLV